MNSSWAPEDRRPLRASIKRPDARVQLSHHDLLALVEYHIATARLEAHEAADAESDSEMIDKVICAHEHAQWAEGLQTLAEDMERAAHPLVAVPAPEGGEQ